MDLKYIMLLSCDTVVEVLLLEGLPIVQTQYKEAQEKK